MITEPIEDDEDALREDVSRLGHMLGETLERLEGKSIYAHVELARQSARDRRENGDTAANSFARLLSNLTPPEATAVSRAFSTYFGLVNLAERVHRIRMRRRRPERKAPPVESFEAVLTRLQEHALSMPEVQAVIDRTQFKPVFTAHPTEAVRRTLLTKEQRIASQLIARIDGATDHESSDARLEQVRDEVGLAWQTDEHFSQPSVSDEVEHVLFYLSNAIYEVLPQLHTRLASACSRVFGTQHGLQIPDRVVRFGSWVGADMDGNPNVGADTIIATLQRQRAVIIECYRREVRELFDHLSQSMGRVNVSQDLLARIESDLSRYPEIRLSIPERYTDMPYRMFMWIIWHRLAHTIDDGAGGYRGPQELLTDLQLVLSSVNCHGATGANRIRALALRVRCFGFHMASLDVRQDAAVHREAVSQALGDSSFPSLPSTQRSNRLHQALANLAPVQAEVDSTLAGCLEVMSTIQTCLKRFGSEAIGLYIISMASDVDDALAVLYLARLAGLDSQHTPIDVAPLFETVDDLEQAPRTLDQMLTDPQYRSHLGKRGGRQFVMLGYSDSSKQAGIAASRFALHQAQRALVLCMQPYPELSLTLFHGRGGTISRGGGEPRNGILAEPPGALIGNLRVTEQGEIIGQKYGIGETAVHTMETALGAIMERAVAQRLEPPDDEPWMAIAEQVASASRSNFEELLAQKALIPFFRHATPIDVIERLRIGSRPASRQGGDGVAGLRAIPWVFAWTQSRHALTGWYGLGHGLHAAVNDFGLDTLRAMAKGWRFFATLLSDAEMVLAKADMGIATLYAQLAPADTQPLHERIKQEFESTRAIVCELLEQDALLSTNPDLARALKLRAPYVDPLHLIQVDFLNRWRAGDREDVDAERVLAETVRGIARGMQNTG